MVVLCPRPGFLGNAGAFVIGHDEDSVDGCFEGPGIDEEVCSQMSWFGPGCFDKDSSAGADEFVHRWSVRGEDQGSTTHRFHDIMSPAFGEGRAEVDGVLIDESDDVVVAHILGDEIDVAGHALRRIVFVLQESESGPLGVFGP